MIALGTFAGSDVAAISSSTEVSTLPATNLLRRQVYDRWRTPGTSGHVTLNYSSFFPVRCIWMGYTNATAAATIRVRGGFNFATVTSSPLFDTGVIQHWPGTRDWSAWDRTHALIFLSGVVQGCTAWRIDVDQVSGASFYEAGRLYLGDPWRPSRGLDFGDGIQPFDASQRRRARSGAAHAFEGGRYRVGTGRLSALPLIELQRVLGELERLVGGISPLLYLRDPENLTIGIPTIGTGLYMRTDAELMDQSLYGYFTEPPYPVNEGLDFYRASFSIEEAEHP